MSTTDPAAQDTKRPKRGTYKHLHVRLERADDEAIVRGLAGLRLLGVATVRTRSDFLRHCLHEVTRRTVEAVRFYAQDAK